jgi:uncharacterized protein YciI
MAHFAVVTMRGPAWDATRGIREQRLWTEHARFTDDLVAAGSIVIGGPIESPDGRVIALLAVEADDENAVRTLFSPDPWIEEGVIELMHVRRWTLWLDGRAPLR